MVALDLKYIQCKTILSPIFSSSWKYKINTTKLSLFLEQHPNLQIMKYQAVNQRSLFNYLSKYDCFRYSNYHIYSCIIRTFLQKKLTAKMWSSYYTRNISDNYMKPHSPTSNFPTVMVLPFAVVTAVFQYIGKFAV